MHGAEGHGGFIYGMDIAYTFIDVRYMHRCICWKDWHTTWAIYVHNLDTFMYV